MRRDLDDVYQLCINLWFLYINMFKEDADVGKMSTTISYQVSIITKSIRLLPNQTNVCKIKCLVLLPHWGHSYKKYQTICHGALKYKFLWQD